MTADELGQQFRAQSGQTPIGSMTPQQLTQMAGGATRGSDGMYLVGGQRYATNPYQQQIDTNATLAHPPPTPQSDRAGALGLTQGFGQGVMNDPRIGTALDMLKGAGTPYTQQVINQQTNQAADQNARAESTTAASIRQNAAALGENPNSPAVQAQLRQAQTGRLQGNVSAAGNIQSQATLANSQASLASGQAQGNLILNQANTARPALGQAAGLLAGEQFSSGHQNGFAPQFVPQFQPSQGPQMPAQPPMDPNLFSYQPPAAPQPPMAQPNNPNSVNTPYGGSNPNAAYLGGWADDPSASPYAMA